MSATDNMSTPSILDLINQTLELPTMPTVLTKLNQVMADPESSAEEVAKVISLDPSVATNILRIVNSAYYGLQVRVSSVNLAVSIMGFNMTKKVALKAAVFSIFGGKKAKKIKHFKPEDFWVHSIYTGILARAIGQGSPHFQGIHPEDLYICGLLHDIGKIIMLENAPESFEECLQQSIDQGRPDSDVEQEILGYTHADVGSVLAIKWFLPEDLTIAIRYHHAPSRDPFHKTLSGLICLADNLASQQGHCSAGEGAADHAPEELYELVGLDPADTEELLARVNEEFASTGMPW